MITRRERAGVEGESRIIVLRAAHMRAGLFHLLLRCLPFQPQVFSHTCPDTETSFDERNAICRGLEVKFLLWMSILAKFWLRLKKKKKAKHLTWFLTWAVIMCGAGKFLYLPFRRKWSTPISNFRLKNVTDSPVHHGSSQHVETDEK